MENVWRMRRSRVLAPFLLFCTALSVCGCGRSFAVEKELVALAEEYTERLAAGRFDEALEFLTGEALEAAMLSLPLLEAVEVENRVVSFEGRCDFLNRARDRGSVEAVYVQEQTVRGYGTSVAELVVLYEFKKVDGRWKIYRIVLLEKSERK